MEVVRTVAESALIATLVIGFGAVKLHWMRSRDERQDNKSSARR